MAQCGGQHLIDRLRIDAARIHFFQVHANPGADNLLEQREILQQRDGPGGVRAGDADRDRAIPLLRSLIDGTPRERLTAETVALIARAAGTLKATELLPWLVERLAAEPALAGWDGLGVVVQAYQKRAPFVIDYIAHMAKQLGRRIPVRLVKGAYWDAEVKRAQVEGQAGYPLFTRKQNTDVSYLANARRLLDAGDAIYPMFATHNAQTIASVHRMARAMRTANSSASLGDAGSGWCTGVVPHCSASRRATGSDGVTATMGARGRYSATMFAVLPWRVNAGVVRWKAS